jgi:hypothetical protein
LILLTWMRGALESKRIGNFWWEREKKYFNHRVFTNHNFLLAFFQFGHRSFKSTPLNAILTCMPHPTQVGFLHCRQEVLEHISLMVFRVEGFVVAWVFLWYNNVNRGY